MSDFRYLDGVAGGRLLLQRCSRCKAVKMLSAMGTGPVDQPMCPECHSLEWDTFEASGRGTVGAYVLNVRAKAEPKPIFAVVVLEEGPAFYSTIVGASEDEVYNEMPVHVVFSEEDGCVLLQFQPVR